MIYIVYIIRFVTSYKKVVFIISDVVIAIFVIMNMFFIKNLT